MIEPIHNERKGWAGNTVKDAFVNIISMAFYIIL